MKSKQRLGIKCVTSVLATILNMADRVEILLTVICGP